MKHISTAFALTALALTLSGCVVALGNREENKKHPSTLGKDLIDLKEAKDQGALSEQEYEYQKRRLLEERGKR